MQLRSRRRRADRHREPGPGLRRYLVGAWLFGLSAGLGYAVGVAPESSGPPRVAASVADPSRHHMAPSTDRIRAGVVWDEEMSGPQEVPPRRFTVAAAGDVLVHMPVTHQAQLYGAATGAVYDFAPMFDEVRAAFQSADLSICHLEVPLSGDSAGLSGFPRFSAPPQLADALATASFDTCSTASNHAVDRGGAGVTATLDALDDAGVAHVGTARSPEEADRPRLHEVAEVTVGHVAGTYGLNGLPLPAGEPWRVDLLDADHLRARAAAARDAGAEFVVASLHWGQEYRQAPTAEQRAVADVLLADGGVDLIVGHHAHVVQPLGRIGGRPVAFGLGNFLSNQSGACCAAGAQDGVIARFEVEEESPGEFAVTGVAAVPTWVDRTTYSVVDVLTALDAPETPADRRALLEQSLGRTLEALTADGETVDLVPAGSRPADLAPVDAPPPAGLLQ